MSKTKQEKPREQEVTVKRGPVRQRQVDASDPEAFIRVKRIQYGGEQPDEEIKVSVPALDPRAAVSYISVTGSQTINLGDFNSCRAEVTVQLPCYPVDSEINHAYNWASEKVEQLLNLEVGYRQAERGHASAADEMWGGQAQ